jgi:carbonic anhydrase
MTRPSRWAAAVLLAAVSFPHAARGEGGRAHWDYEKGHEGPAHWAQLSPEYAACAAGTHGHQSPIDIRGAEKANLPAIQVAYQAGAATVVNNGHTIQVNFPPGSRIMVGDHSYELQQFHFHAPSEEAIAGKHAALVVHLVHKDAEGKLAVIGVLYDVGSASPTLGQVFAAMPNKPDAEAPLGQDLDPATLLPAHLGYYTFEGSLTTPPCSEGVRWLVLQRRGTLSNEQLQAFRKLFPHNARPLQPLNGRTVQSSS